MANRPSYWLKMTLSDKWPICIPNFLLKLCVSRQLTRQKVQLKVIKKRRTNHCRWQLSELWLGTDKWIGLMPHGLAIGKVRQVSAKPNWITHWPFRQNWRSRWYIFRKMVFVKQSRAVSVVPNCQSHLLWLGQYKPIRPYNGKGAQPRIAPLGGLKLNKSGKSKRVCRVASEMSICKVNIWTLLIASMQGLIGTHYRILA